MTVVVVRFILRPVVIKHIMKCLDCDGTSSGLQNRFARRPLDRLRFYRDMYENCTIVTSNLEIVYLSSDSWSFFENIREVHGYVLVAMNLVDRLPLTSLRVIRGLQLFQSKSASSSYSLFVAGNSVNTSLGLRRLELPGLMGEQQY